MADTVITITIPEEKFSTARNGFVKKRPIPRDTDGSNLYSPKRWIAECLAEYLERMATAGQREIAQDAVSVDVTVTRE